MITHFYKKTGYLFVALLSILLSYRVCAADWDIVASPNSPIITLPTPTANSESSNVGIPPNSGSGKILENNVNLSIPNATLPIKAESIIGDDNRSIVTNTTSFPYRTSCLLVITYPSGIAYGSGNLISNNTIITAGHCVYDKGYGGWASKIEVYAGRNGSYSPFGKVSSKTLYTLKKWIDSSSSEYDLGYIKLDEKLGLTTGWLGLTTSLNSDINLTGFPMPSNRGFKMYTQKGKIQKNTANNIYYDLDTEGGQSGSSVYNTSNQVIGVHAYGASTVNFGTRLNTQNFETSKKYPIVLYYPIDHIFKI